ncbi:ribonucleoside-triphosphate reductase, adenosylcobalamin-dependent [Streptomyces mobaraensis NBRC 13819 = DSM 40847]|uniref:Adenosylcobalamin-dependent ribonucleoside-triphosphate reductase n=1 Tax=Streptomyces mobaraensis (strain ATCC 29032 / DSM 40847 / JCM 4168 / NBRC 13819 / NCIMB 11159 / IPCR 16-22) TaxID=1223523 RepID=M3CEJ2_STRM1|nr:ribonucleoside-triphosphate reductase, adenosylcobalamin-dependent [Streptomyces mobaraensis]EMF02416.1 gp50 [Streptomyces mobaraensis NBRC 13819 = DSM 40847]QTT76933.1 ribonucleoside-triphosphate reductase, adenosylcobalamin-dependent [Streptomyces mobaraensis NBRC 13819 = DSM 40847]
MKFTQTGRDVFKRTYARPLPDGSLEDWSQTVERVVRGNTELVAAKHIEPGEVEALTEMLTNLEIVPAGRHLWASGVAGRQFLYNCHVAPWSGGLADHVEFTFMRLMEGGGVGARYGRDAQPEEPVMNELDVHIVCDEQHQDHAAMKEAGYLSAEYGHEWPGAYTVEDSREGWARALVDLIETYLRTDVKNRRRVYNVSRVRHAGAPLRTFGGTASGPLPLAKLLIEVARVMNQAGAFKRPVSGLEAMEIDHLVAECVVSGGNRRSARMSMMHWTDPEIMQFINAKKDGGMWTTNLSVITDSDFIKDIDGSTGIEHATQVFDAVVDAMYVNGEPGFWNEELSNRDEPNLTVATNPCGEQPLPEMGSCTLGHVNLGALWKPDQEDRLFEAHRLMVRYLIRATFGDITYPKQQRVMERDRRIGLGHLGVQWFANLNGLKFSEMPDSWMAGLLTALYEHVEETAQQYAREMRIPVPVKLTTIAPTGSVSKLSGVSEGLHPIYAKYFNRRIRFSSIDPKQIEQLKNYEEQGYHVEDCVYAPFTKVVTIPTEDTLIQEVNNAGINAGGADRVVECADDLSVDDMLAVQAFYQEHFVDSAISFTVNFDPNKVSKQALRSALLKYMPDIKGTTVLPEGSYAQAPYERITKEEFDAASAKESGDAVDIDCAKGACPIK